MSKQVSDLAIPILRFRNLKRLVGFYSKLGFKLVGPGAAPDPYLIATRGAFEIHFVKAKKAGAGMAYLRTGSVERVHRKFSQASAGGKGSPRLSPVEDKPWGMREFSIVDCDGNLLRIGEFR